MHEDCSVYKTVDFISKKWTLLIILELYKTKNGKKRYSEIKQSIPEITPKVLSARLKELQEKGLVNKNIDSSEFPIKCEYSLTDSGKDFIGIIRDIKQWALQWNIRNKECEKIECKDCKL